MQNVPFSLPLEDVKKASNQENKLIRQRGKTLSL